VGRGNESLADGAPGALVAGATADEASTGELAVATGAVLADAAAAALAVVFGGVPAKEEAASGSGNIKAKSIVTRRRMRDFPFCET
jgi:hypothetical protein